MYYCYDLLNKKGVEVYLVANILTQITQNKNRKRKIHSHWEIICFKACK